MADYKFCFVILHYLTLEDTVECVESIKNNISYNNYSIIIVDNCSPNDTGKLLDEKYRDNSDVTLILNSSNLGFAKGNNVGFNYAKYKLGADFIALINNDTFIKQTDFIEQVIAIFENKKFHILGPDIISTTDNSHQNPRNITLQNKERLIGYLKLYKYLLILNYFGLDKAFENLKKTIISKPIVSREKELNLQWNKEYENVKVHGSAIIFSSKYIEKYDGLNPSTFMYSEEAILFYIAQRDKLKIIYSPDVKIFHKEDSSTNSLYKKKLLKRRFYYKNFIHSGKVLLGLMDEEN